MGGSVQQDQGSENKIKTFPIPYDPETIKEEISINTNLLSKYTKEQIINQAIKFHTNGDIQEAIKYYKYFMPKFCEKAEEDRKELPLVAFLTKHCEFFSEYKLEVLNQR